MSKLHEAVFGCMQSALRRGGVTVPFEQMEAMKVDCDRLADTILETIRTESLVPVKKLQGATLDAFRAIEEDIKALENRQQRPGF